MARRRLRTIVAALVLTVALVPAVATAPGASATSPPAPPAGFSATATALQADLAKLTGGGAKGATLIATVNALVQTIVTDVTKNKLCPAVGLIATLRADLATLGALGVVVDAVVGDVLTLLAELLGDPRTIACGGASRSSSGNQGVGTGLGRSDTTTLELHLRLPTPSFVMTSAGGRRWAVMNQPGVSGTDQLGEPSVPVVTTSFAVPVGAAASVQVVGSSGYDIPGIALVPTQQSQVVAATPPPQDVAYPFQIDQATYASSAAYPATVATVTPTATWRDLQTATTSSATATYRPASSLLHVFTALDVTVSFTANGGTFGTTDVMAVDEQPFRELYQSLLVNFSALTPARLGAGRVRFHCGEDVVIVTSTDQRSLGAAYGRMYRQRGLIPLVAAVGDAGVGSTTDTIRQFLAGEVNALGCVRPSYVLLLGTAAQVPTFTVHVIQPTANNEVPPDGPLASDQPYAYPNAKLEQDTWSVVSTTMPSLLVGRVAGDDRALELFKSYRYALHPPAANSAYYGTVAGYSGFESCPDGGCQGSTQPSTRDVQGFTKVLVDSLTFASAGGKNLVARVHSGGPTVTPAQDSSGRPFPSYMTFNAGGQDAVNEFNAGHFLHLYYEHGWGDGAGWFAPDIEVSLPNGKKGAVDVTALGQDPAADGVVFSFSCDTGNFDLHANNFTDSMVAAEGGPVSMVAGTRESMGYTDNMLAPATMNAVFPELENYLSSAWFGSAAAQHSPVRTAAAALLAGEMNELRPINTALAAKSTFEMAAELEFEEFGDPTLPIYRDVPKSFDLTGNNFSAQVSGSDINISLNNQPDASDATVTLFDQEAGTYLARTRLNGGVGTLHLDHPLDPTTVPQLVVTKTGYIPASPPAPTVSRVTPNHGPQSGGTVVDIHGTGFTAVNGLIAQLGLSHTSITNYTVNSSTDITATIPPGVDGMLLEVHAIGGINDTTDGTIDSIFLYDPVVTSISPTSGSKFGGTTVTITGVGLSLAQQVSIGSTVITDINTVSDNTITFVTPPGTGANDVHVQVVFKPGYDTSPETISSATVSGDVFTYTQPPTITGLSPSYGSVYGGTTVTITGSGFLGATGVDFGGGPAQSFTVVDDQHITAVSPGNDGASVYVHVTGPGGTSPDTDSAVFSYIGGGG